MTLYALDDIDDAIEATKRFLRPVERARWLRLAVVMFFVTSGGLSTQFPGVPGPGGVDVGDGFGPGPGEPAGTGAGVGTGATGAPPELTPELTPALIALVVGLVAVAAVVVLGYMFVAAVMEFVFVASLRDEEVRLRSSFGANLGRGFRLFAFRLGVMALTTFAVVVGAIGTGVAVGGWPPTQWGMGAILAAVLVALPLVALAAVVTGNLLGFTTVFVVPIMLTEDRGALSAWRRFWPTVTGQWKQFLVYAVVGFLLGIGVGIAAGFLVLVAAVGLALPTFAVGVAVFLVAGLGPVGGPILLVLGVFYLLAVLVVSLVVQVPFQTFLRYYALFVLGDADPDFDVIPDARAAVRADGAHGVGA